VTPFAVEECPDIGCGDSLSEHNGIFIGVDGTLYPICDSCGFQCSGAGNTPFARMVRERLDTRVRI